MGNSEQKSIRFRFSPEKAKEAISWMLFQAGRPLDLHTILKSCYFADREHINKYGRPIFGAVYRAMKFGPVPVEIYEMLKCEPIWLAELDAQDFPWTISGYEIAAANIRNDNISFLSQSDMECLKGGLDRSMSLNFTSRTAATHGLDWQKANLGYMRYEDMIEDTDNKTQMVEMLRQTAPLMRL